MERAVGPVDFLLRTPWPLAKAGMVWAVVPPISARRESIRSAAFGLPPPRSDFRDEQLRCVAQRFARPTKLGARVSDHPIGDGARPLQLIQESPCFNNQAFGGF